MGPDMRVLLEVGRLVPVQLVSDKQKQLKTKKTCLQSSVHNMSVCFWDDVDWRLLSIKIGLQMGKLIFLFLHVFLNCFFVLFIFLSLYSYF